MKKILLASAALLVAEMVSANAAPLKLSVGGYANWYTGYVDGDAAYDRIYGNPGYNHVPVVADVEVAFKGETALQNGVKIGAVIELAGVTDKGTDEDQSYIYVDSSFGRLAMGKMNSISKQLHRSAKDVGLIETRNSDIRMLQQISAGSTDYRGNDDAATFSYYSPKFAGFTLAASYSDMSEDATHNFDGNGAVYMGIVTYDNTFGSVTIHADVAYARNDAMISSPFGSFGYNNILSVGFRAGVAGFTFGAGYKNENGIGSAGDVNTFDVGIAYEKGPYGVSLAYMCRDQDDYSSNKREEYLASVSYDVTDGVKTFATAGYTKQGIGVERPEAYLLTAGLGLNF